MTIVPKLCAKAVRKTYECNKPPGECQRLCDADKQLGECNAKCESDGTKTVRSEKAINGDPAYVNCKGRTETCRGPPCNCPKSDEYVEDPKGCYFMEAGKCAQEVMFVAPTNLEPQVRQRCTKSPEKRQCPMAECDRFCKNDTQKYECRGECGERGHKIQRSRKAIAGDEFYVNCPWYDTSPLLPCTPCSTTGADRTTKRPNVPRTAGVGVAESDTTSPPVLETWHIILIGLGVLGVLAIFITILVLVMRRNKSDGPHQSRWRRWGRRGGGRNAGRRPSPDHHRRPPPSRGRSTSRSAASSIIGGHARTDTRTRGPPPPRSRARR